ncbi:hypothetical protein ACSFA3_08070 [Variovorax sp. RHLX14]|uniref:hypothetical protein n=1 Tax=Variovorax sp. RHLX14 TaxID=1259731 RepID=UPI003F48502A
MIFRFAFLVLFACGSGGALQAQELPPGVALGMTPEALRAAVPTVERVARPVRIAGGLTGSWHGQPEFISGLPFEPTFYFSGGELRRVEWVGLPEAEGDRGVAAYAELLVWGRSRFGAELASRDPGSELASWVAGDTDVYAQRIDDPRCTPSVRLVYKLRRLRDASQL